MADYWEEQKQNAEVIPPTAKVAPVVAASQPTAPDFRDGASEVVAAPAHNGFFDGTTTQGVIGALTRGAAPYAAAALTGGAMGIPGGLPGMVAGATGMTGLFGLAQMLGDPLVDAWNIAFPNMKTQHPTEAMQNLITMAGLPQAQSGIERTLQSGSAALAESLGVTNAGKALVNTLTPLVNNTMRGIGTALADRPVLQAASSAAAGAAGQVAAESGLPPWAQAGVGFGTGGLVGLGGAIKTPAQIKPQTFDPTANVRSSSTMEDLGALGAQASGNGAAADAAKTRLAVEARVNGPDMAAGQNLGFNLPADVYSDSNQVKAMAGLNRSMKTSDAAGDWRDVVEAASEHGAKIMEDTGALYSNGGPSMDMASQQVKNALTTSRDSLEGLAEDLYKQVKTIVPINTRTSANNIREYLNERIDNLGGWKNDEGYNQLSSPEKRLFKMVYATDAKGKLVPANPTYAALQENKQLIGKQAFDGADPYPDADRSMKMNLYRLISADQTEAVGASGSSDAVEMMAQANRLWSQKKGMEDKLITLFGKDEATGSLATKLQTAMAKGANKNDSAAFMVALNAVPDDLRKPVLATTLASLSKAKGGSEAGGFGFAEYKNLYNGLRSNPTVYNEMVKALGPGSDDLLRSLFMISERMTTARANVSTTGASMQGYLQGMDPTTLVNTILGKVAVHGATGAGGAAGGGVGAIVGSTLANAFTNGGKGGVEKASKLFLDPKFQAMLSNPEQAAAVASSPAYQAFAKYAGLPRELRGAITFLKSALLGADVATYQTTGPMSALEQNRVKALDAKTAPQQISIRERVRAAQKTGGK